MSTRFHANMLDDTNRLATVDPAGMRKLIAQLPNHCEEAIEIVNRTELPSWDHIENIVILGMGGSAIGGNLARSLLEGQCRVPIVVNPEYTIPGFVGSNTLVVASSYSGNTEETLTGFKAAAARGAKIIVISTGGELARLASADGYPHIKLPGGIQPRAAVGYSSFSLFVLFWRLGFVDDVQDALSEAIELLKSQNEQLAPEVPFAKNRAKQLALTLAGKIPLIYGSGGWRGVAAYRWKCQVNENSKAVSFWNSFPELNHNETVGWEYPELTKDIHVVFLRDHADDPRIQKRVEVTQKLMRDRIAGMSEVWAEGESHLAKLMSLVYPGDYVSFYLAVLYGADPTPVHVIERLKSELGSL